MTATAPRRVSALLGAARQALGHQPLREQVDTLRAIGFDGVVSVECRLRGDPEDAIRGCGRYLRGLIDAAAG